jgi:hypothetical protein
MFLFDTESPDHDNFKVRAFDKVGGGAGCITWVASEPGNFICGDSRAGLIRYYNISQT